MFWRACCVCWAYPMASVSLWPWARKFWLDRVRHRFVDNKTLGTKSTKPWLVRVGFVLVWYFLTSETVEVLVDGFVWFGLGIWWLYDDSDSVHALMSPKESEKEMSID